MKDKNINALDQVSISIDSGEFVAIRGPSGCGKSSLLLSIGGMSRPTEGELIIDNTSIYKLSKNERCHYRGTNIGFIFQAFHLIPYLSVKDNILSANIHSGKYRTDQVDALMDKFNLGLRSNHKPSELSTGEKQRVALARAFLNEPSIILADEPTGNLDPQNAIIVLNHLKEFQKNGGTVVLVTHQNNAEEYSDRTINMETGKIIS